MPTTPHRATSETPFSLVYGNEVMVPTKASVSSLRCEVCLNNKEVNNEILEDMLDVIDERRDKTIL